MTIPSAEATLARAIRDSGGVVRQATLIAGGWSKADIARAVARRDVTRVRRSWLASPDADPYLVAAARAGVVLTCVTQARRLGLWVLAEDRPHVAAPAHSGAVRILTDDEAGKGEPKASTHWGKPLIARDPQVLVDPIENVLAAVAHCQRFESALIVWESALRNGLVDAQALSRLSLSAAAHAILEQANPYSDSGLETLVIPRLQWMKLRVLAQIWIAGHRVDFLIGERLVLQIDGGHHVGAQREADIRHDAQLMLLGYHVVRVGYWQVVEDWASIQNMIMRAVAQGLHRAA